MAGIYIASTAPRAGKSLLSFSLGILLQQAGMSVGYMKPLGRTPQKHDELLGDADALVIQEVLGQNMPADALTPLMLPRNLHGLAMAGETGQSDGTLTRIREAYAKISEGKDLTLISGTAAFPAAGRFANVDGLRLVRTLGLKVLFIERYTDGINFDGLLLLKDLLGSDLLGLVLNDVPEEEMRDVYKVLIPWLETRGIAVHGVMGHEPGLTAIRANDLAHSLNGHIVAGSAHASRMVNGFLIGAMQVGNFMLHLRNHKDCAVIVGGDRLDLQLAALYAKIPCIILTGNIAPSEMIRAKAEDRGVTLLMVKEDTYTAAQALSRILRFKKLRDLAQIRLAVELAKKSLKLEGILQALGEQSRQEPAPPIPE